MPDAKAVLSASLRRVAREGKLRRFVEAPQMSHEIVRRYVAGESVAAAVETAAELAKKHRLVCFTSLQACPDSEDAARAVTKRYRKLLRRLGEAGLASDGRCEVGVSLEALGGELGPEGRATALANARRICQAAANAGALVTLETTRAETVDDVLDVVEDLRQDFPWVGVALQAALRRTESDVRELLGTRIRIGKGPTGHDGDRYHDAPDVDRAFARILKTLLAGPGMPIVSTQDIRLIEITDALAHHLGRPNDQYEYLIRYGVRPETQAVIGDRGDRCRVYTPFGEDWYSYLISRVADDPTNVGDLLKAAFAR